MVKSGGFTVWEGHTGLWYWTLNNGDGRYNYTHPHDGSAASKEAATYEAKRVLARPQP